MQLSRVDYGADGVVQHVQMFMKPYVSLKECDEISLDQDWKAYMLLSDVWRLWCNIVVGFERVVKFGQGRGGRFPGYQAIWIDDIPGIDVTIMVSTLVRVFWHDFLAAVI